MQQHSAVAIVSLIALLAYLATGIGVARARRRSGIMPPQMTGDAGLERAIRIQSNTLEWLPVFLVSLWLFAVYCNSLVAAHVGAVWILARIAYAWAYARDPAKRELPFIIQALACAVLLFGALGCIVLDLASRGG